jgi:hypothetical protein
MKSKDEKEITFFMLVTNRDACIADYAVKSYQQLERRGLQFTLLIYANCLVDNIKSTHFPRWAKYQFVKIYDNKEKVKHKHIKAGNEFVTPHGIKLRYEANCEHCDDLWSTELRTISTAYHATVDADFEILRPEFVFKMLRALKEDPLLVAISSNYSHTKEDYYDSYSDMVIRLNQRWHTWFCIYKKEALECKESHHYYETMLPDGRRNAFDSAGFFQHQLINTFGYTIKAIDLFYQNQFVHYGAFSKNRTLDSKNIKLYRILVLIKKNGLLSINNENIIVRILNKMARLIAAELFHMLFGKVDKERRVYNYKD